MLGRSEIPSKIGESGRCEVYLAEDSQKKVFEPSRHLVPTNSIKHWRRSVTVGTGRLRGRLRELSEDPRPVNCLIRPLILLQSRQYPASLIWRPQNRQTIHRPQ